MDALDKANLIDRHRDINVDYAWWSDIYTDFDRVADWLGITVSDKSFSGFCSQGDGASFTGVYNARSTWAGETAGVAYESAPARVRAEYPQDFELHRIADELCMLSRIYYPADAVITRLSHQYAHSNTMGVDTEPADGEVDNWAPEVHAIVEDKMLRLMRDLADWLYDWLREEYDYRTSDEVVWDTIEANDLHKEDADAL